MLVRTLKRCSGAINFDPEQEIELEDAVAVEMLAAGAVVSLEQPKSEEKRPVKKADSKQGE